MLQADIKRDMQHNYLHIKDEAVYHSSYQRKMIQYNAITGLIPLQQECLNDNRQLQYEITGLQPLKEVISKSQITQGQLICIIKSLLDLLNRLPEYLLRCDDVILQSEYIYIKIPEYEAQVCYYPGFHNPIRQQIVHFFEYLMNCINYKDKDTVYLVYSIYMKSKEIDCTIPQLKDIILGQSYDKNVEQLITNDVFQPMESSTHSESIPVLQKDVINREHTIHINKYYVGVGVVSVIVFFLCYRSGMLYEGLANKISMIRFIIVALISILVSAVGGFLLKFLIEKKGFSYTETAAVKETTKSGEEYNTRKIVKQLGEGISTPSITPMKEKKEKSMAYETMLVSLNPKGYDSIHFPYFPCYIGAAAENTSVQVTLPGISQYHIKISRKGCTYFITDLNSTKGTKLNNIRIKPDLEYELHDDDTITLAEISYRFQYSMLQDCMLQEYNN